jgi:nitroreductase
MNDTVNLLKSHRSIRKYKEKPVPEEAVLSIIECAQSASTSNFIQAYTIIRVNSAEKRKKIAALAGDQKYVAECPLFLVFCADLQRANTSCGLHGKTMDAGCEAFIVATVDAALAAQNAMTAAESMGLGGVYIGGIRNDPAGMCEILNIPNNVYPVFGMCLGYPDDDPQKKERLPLNVIFKTDAYSDDADSEKIKEYDARINAYYRQRGSASRDDTWTLQISAMMGRLQRPHMKEFLEKRGFLLK